MPTKTLALFTYVNVFNVSNVSSTLPARFTTICILFLHFELHSVATTIVRKNIEPFFIDRWVTHVFFCVFAMTLQPSRYQKDSKRAPFVKSSVLVVFRSVFLNLF